LWPRYAREEFFEAGRSALRTAGKLLAFETDAYIRGQKVADGVEQIRLTFAQQLSTLRNLLQAGARESTYFRARLANYHAFLVSLTDLFQSALDLDRRRRDESPILERLRDELEAANTAISEEFEILTRPRLRNEKLPPNQLKAPFALLEEKISAIRSVCRAEPAATSCVDHHHRIVPGVDPRNGHSRSRREIDLAGAAAATFQG
jgi:hypothetical protein